MVQEGSSGAVKAVLVREADGQCGQQWDSAGSRETVRAAVGREGMSVSVRVAVGSEDCSGTVRA